ncbi:mycofactocin-coupled SDR family oxidoreductase [Pseudonocardia humida]|uniref:Mycofactocin-coupled SDR family oxidoreductase n=1 Tax=Pseudonocardia humida TaxID=2800819 RepID=A0ABT1AAC5_9PSEU|nr:mycofactocin-coupled SDR family oxidoreductase [Pseudonocardia humida]MCO1659906.1 mycofactocin-coupled SDR family oxidoreductase [Pseudonocardia humida]
MMGKFEGKVAFITGAARGQGRAHAIRLAEEGADIIAVDICAPIETVPYPLGTAEDLEETERAVEKLDRRIHAEVADVRDRAALQAAFERGVGLFGRVDVVVANAGVFALAEAGEGTLAQWADGIEVNLTGTFNTVEVARPLLVEQGEGGSIVLISSTAGLNGMGAGAHSAEPGGLAYTASKHGIVGLMRSYANILARHSIRVNSVHPTGVDTPMILNDKVQAVLQAAARQGQAMTNALPVPMVEARDIANAVAWLASDEARYVTGVALPVDAGFTVKR